CKYICTVHLYSRSWIFVRVQPAYNTSNEASPSTTAAEHLPREYRTLPVARRCCRRSRPVGSGAARSGRAWGGAVGGSRRGPGLLSAVVPEGRSRGGSIGSA